MTGASRGAGRAIAAVLGEHGATVYVTGRSVRGQPTTDNLPGTIEDSAEEVTRRGGQGIAVRCDHANELEVESLFRRVRDERGRLDILVNNAWGGYEGERLMPAYFWQAPLRLWDGMFERGLKAHLLATYFAIPLMIDSASAAARTRVRVLPGSSSAPWLGTTTSTSEASTMLLSARSCACFGAWQSSFGSTVSQPSLWLPGSCAPRG